MKNLLKNPKTRTRNLVILILPFVILALVFGFIAVKSASSIVNNSTGTATKEAFKDSIDSMDYHLRSNATNLQTSLFKDLTSAVKDGSDKFEIAKLVAENFVADFYTWSNKDGTYDVGGMYYVYSPEKVNIYKQAVDGFYKYVTYYINTYGSDKLIEVDSIEAEVGDTTGTYEYDNKSWTSYYVTCTWTYKNEDTFSDIYLYGTNSLEQKEAQTSFIKKMYFTIIENEDGRFEIVQAYGDN